MNNVSELIFTGNWLSLSLIFFFSIFVSLSTLFYSAYFLVIFLIFLILIIFSPTNLVDISILICSKLIFQKTFQKYTPLNMVKLQRLSRSSRARLLVIGGILAFSSIFQVNV